MTIIQARTASTRLPNKVLQPICGRQVLDIVIAKCQRIEGSDQVVVATSNKSGDVPIVDHVNAQGVAVFSGDESNVLKRFYEAATEFRADAIVRITADCPLLDPDISSLVVAKFCEGGWDYVSNIKPPTYPDGLDTEVISVEAIERALREATKPSETEHVTPYIWRNPELFRLANVENQTDLSELRWTLDNAEDLGMMRALCERLEVDLVDASLDDLLKVWNENPDIQQKSSESVRNESLVAQFRAEERHDNDG